MEVDIEEFDLLRDYLTEYGRIKPGESVSFTKLVGGVSNRTVRVARADVAAG